MSVPLLPVSMSESLPQSQQIDEKRRRDGWLYRPERPEAMMVFGAMI